MELHGKSMRRGWTVESSTYTAACTAEPTGRNPLVVTRARRIYLPKPDGRQRPIGIAALEDKIVQQAVVTILNEIYEVDFRGVSYGFRPGRHAHQALDALAVGIQRWRVNWILDADSQGFFDTLKHEWLIQFLEHRVTDSRILRLIQERLKAGVVKMALGRRVS